MKHIMTRLKQLLLYAGLEKEEYDKIQSIFLAPNWMILTTFSIVVALVSIGFIILSFFNTTVVSDSIAFCCTAVIMIVIAVINVTNGKNNEKLLNALDVIFITATYMLGIYNGTIGDPNNTSITFIVLVVGLPMVLNGRPVIMIGEMLLACAVFLIVAINVKSPDVIDVDVADVIAFAFISLALNLHLVVVKVQGYFAQYQANEATAKAEAANVAKTEFLFNMSHDIRTPMNAVIGFTNLLEKEVEGNERAKDYLKKIQISNDFLLSLINNVLEMSRIESGKVILDETANNVYAFWDSMHDLFDNQMDEKGITFTSDIRVDHPNVMVDATKIREVYLNIVSNALKYTPTGGKVSMVVEELPIERQGYVTYKTVITDTGIGMSKVFLPHIFEEFSRERTSTESKLTGTGLGMPIVKKLVDLMQGEIEVESEQGKGTKFTLTISHRIADASDTRLEGEYSIDYKAEDFVGKRILLAEDNELNAEIAMSILEIDGFLVEWAEDGIICVDMLQKADPDYYDLVLMDIQMPNMDGYKATQAIRRLPDSKKANIPIVAMTANAFDEDRKMAFTMGMNGHISKPIEIETLRNMLWNVLFNKEEGKEIK